jgi:Cu(I)/Ag(I) efflux system membrane fusion protein
MAARFAEMTHSSPAERGARLASRGLLALLIGALAACGAPSSPSLGPPPSNEVALSSAVIQRLGVRTAAAEFGVLPNDTRAPGIVRYDESSIVDVSVPIAGWVETSAVHATGDRVKRGDLLFEIYSPTLVTTDAQYLRSLETGADPKDNPYARGLLASGLSENMVAAVKDKQRNVGRLPFRAARDGVVSTLSFRQGAFVTQGAAVLQLVSTDPMWVVADVPESAAAGVAADTPVTITATAFPGWSYEGTIDRVYPQVAATARSVQARIVVPAADPALLAGMYVSVLLHNPAAEPSVNVPASAVIRGQDADRVIVALGDGRFAPRGVKVGRAAGDRVAVLEGLRQGESVVTQATFLIDAEASVRANIARMDSADTPALLAPSPHAKHAH